MSIPIRFHLPVLVLVTATTVIGQTNNADRFISMREPVVAFTHARIIDGLGNGPVENRTLVVRDGEIAALGTDGSVVIPDDAKVVDASGKTVMPGLVMVHEHLYYSSLAGPGYHVNQQEYSFPKLYLAAGITSMRTTGSVEPYTDLALKEAIDAGTEAGPKIHLTTPYFDGEGTGIMQLRPVKEAAAAVRMVNYWADEGFTSIKVYLSLSREVMRAAIDAAHARGMQVTGHIGRVSYREAAELGIDNIEHGFFASSDFVPDREPDDPADSSKEMLSISKLDPDSKEFADLVDVLIRHRVAITSTLAIFETFVPGKRLANADELAALAAPLREVYLSRWSANTVRNRPLMGEAFAHGLKLEAKFFRSGGLLAVGTDPTGYGGCIAGYGSWRAIELLVDAGLTPIEAIQVATSNGAKLLKIAGATGSIEVGKAADLVLVDGDPSTDITAIRKAETVFKDGVGYDSAKLFAAAKGLVGIQ